MTPPPCAPGGTVESKNPHFQFRDVTSVELYAASTHLTSQASGPNSFPLALPETQHHILNQYFPQIENILI